MLCELCHKNDAAGVLHRKDKDGEDEELYVCKQCLKAANDHTEATDGTKSETQKAESESGEDEPPAFIKNFLDAAVGLIEGVAGGELPQPKKCPHCGSTWEKIKKEKTIGCPECWAIFAKEIQVEFTSDAYGPRHVGMIPQKTHDGKPSKAFLEKELKEAVAKQNYRKAARIRKQIDGLYGDGKKDGDK